MPAKDRPIRHRFDGGWATDFGTLSDTIGDGDGGIAVPFLLRAENIFYQLNGAVRKVGGTTKYNSTALESGDAVRGMFEFVKVGTAGTPTRKRVCHVGTKVLNDDNDGTFASLVTGLEDDKVPNYSVFQDELIIASDSTVDVPKTWDQSTVANLGGSPPNFSFSVAHVNRLWAAGYAANPSTLYYSGLLDSTDWNGATNSGTIEIDPDDGDIITAIIPYRSVLIVFKGPNFGSVHVVRGATPATFAREIFISGIGAIWQNLVFTFGNDVGFVANDGTIRSLAASDRFGDFEQASLSLPINSWLMENLNLATAKTGWAAVDPTRNYVLLTLPIQSSAYPNTALLMDYRFSSVRWSRWTAFDTYSVTSMSNPSDNARPILYIGGSDGFIRKTQDATRSIDGSGAISSYVQTPFFHYGTAERDKTLHHVGIGTKVVGNSTIALKLKTNVTQTSLSVSLESAGDVLGSASANEFTLGTSTLAEDAYDTKWRDVLTAGQFRNISYELSNATVNEDFEIDTVYSVFEEASNPNYEN